MKTIQHPLLGDIVVNRSARARRISIRVKSTGEVILVVPFRVSEQDALMFLESKAQWVEKSKKHIAAQHPRQIIEMPFATRQHTLYLMPSSTNLIRARVLKGRIEVVYPLDMQYNAPEVQEVIMQGIEAAWRVEAKEYLPLRTEHLAMAAGLKHSGVSVRNSRTRWGSCSPDNSISYSLHLMKLPDHLIDFIILHELCHTLHKNHGDKFHALLDHLLGGKEKALSRELKAFSTRWYV